MDEAGVGADLSLGAHAVNNDPRQKVNEQLTTDLEVGAPTVIYGSQARGATFTLFAQVRNAGDGASAATTLRYYRSTDATITTADTAVGTDFVRGLPPGRRAASRSPLMAPSTAGTYDYGACVDAVTGESDTTNNCSSSVQVTVPAPTPQAQRTSLVVGRGWSTQRSRLGGTSRIHRRAVTGSGCQEQAGLLLKSSPTSSSD